MHRHRAKASFMTSSSVPPGSPGAATPEARLDALTSWAAGVLGSSDFTIAPASSDASFRRYFRIVPATPWRGRSSLIAMDAPPPMEDCRPFVHVSKLMRDAEVNAPEIFASDLTRGFLLLSDLGTTMYLSALDERSARALYLDALDALVRWQAATRDGELPPYDEALLARELELFPDWYVARHLGKTLTDAQRAVLGQTFRTVLDNNLAQPRVYVHRDYHSRNLMLCEERAAADSAASTGSAARRDNPGVLDFQDAVIGPVTYDLVSLLRDAYVAWDEEIQIDFAVRYWERARAAKLPVDSDFSVLWRDFEWMGVQRQLKVLGIFARLYHRDGKAQYLADMPRVMTYLRGACERYNAFTPLLRLLDELEGVTPQVAYTF